MRSWWMKNVAFWQIYIGLAKASLVTIRRILDLELTYSWKYVFVSPHSRRCGQVVCNACSRHRVFLKGAPIKAGASRYLTITFTISLCEVLKLIVLCVTAGSVCNECFSLIVAKERGNVESTVNSFSTTICWWLVGSWQTIRCNNPIPYTQGSNTQSLKISYYSIWKTQVCIFGWTFKIREKGYTFPWVWML